MSNLYLLPSNEITFTKNERNIILFFLWFGGILKMSWLGLKQFSNFRSEVKCLHCNTHFLKSWKDIKIFIQNVNNLYNYVHISHWLCFVFCDICVQIPEISININIIIIKYYRIKIISYYKIMWKPQCNSWKYSSIITWFQIKWFILSSVFYSKWLVLFCFRIRV